MSDEEQSLILREGEDALTSLVSGIMSLVAPSTPQEERIAALEKFVDMAVQIEMDAQPENFPTWRSTDEAQETWMLRKQRRDEANYQQLRAAALEGIRRAASMAKIRQLVDLAGVDTTYLDEDGVQHDVLDTLEDQTPTEDEATSSGRARARRAAVKVIVEGIAAGVEVKKVAEALDILPPSWWAELNSCLNKARAASMIEGEESLDMVEEMERVLGLAKLGGQEMVVQTNLIYLGKKPKTKPIKYAVQPGGDYTRVAMVMPQSQLNLIKFRLGGALQQVGEAEAFSFITADQLVAVQKALARGYDVSEDLWNLIVRAARNHPVVNAVWMMVEKNPRGVTMADVEQVLLYQKEELDMAIHALERLGLLEVERSEDETRLSLVR